MKEHFSFVMFVFVACLFFAVIGGFISRCSEEQRIEEKISSNLFKPHGGNLKIETFVYEVISSDTTTIKKTLENVVYAQLKLYPTIGCAKPTLFYLLDNSLEIKQMIVDRASIVQ
jgi:hypothetical protein